MTTHVRIYDGDPPGSTSIASSSYVNCNCACARCLAGSCCMYPDPAAEAFRGWTTTVTTGSDITVNSCEPTAHDFAALSKKRLFCRKCGTTRDV